MQPGPFDDDSAVTRPLRVLSYNIQVGVGTARYRDYLTDSWKHLLPHANRQANLDRIAGLLNDYDIVGLQEVDSGSLRSSYIDQTAYLAERAGIAHWYAQVNRNMGPIAQHSNGLLTRWRPRAIHDYRLPGLPGRGALVGEFGDGNDVMAIIIAHLALGRRARRRQMQFLRELVARYRHVLLMGDFNCDSDSPEMRELVGHSRLYEPSCEQKTFPSWQPVRKLDHILVTEGMQVQASSVVDCPMSDHLPIQLELQVPQRVRLAA